MDSKFVRYARRYVVSYTRLFSFFQEGRTALHYCAACRDPGKVWDILIEGGCDASVCDKRGNPAAYYLEHSSEVELAETEKMPNLKGSTTKESERTFGLLMNNARLLVVTLKNNSIDSSHRRSDSIILRPTRGYTVRTNSAIFVPSLISPLYYTYLTCIRLMTIGRSIKYKFIWQINCIPRIKDASR